MGYKVILEGYIVSGIATYWICLVMYLVIIVEVSLIASGLIDK